MYRSAETEVGSLGAESSRLGRLVLGTAQFDVAYGLVRAHSKQSEAFEPNRMLSEAFRWGIRSLDTAPGYGTAEQIIGDCGWVGGIATKIDQYRSPQDSLTLSLRRLKRDAVEVVYVHDYSQTASKDFVSDFAELRDNGAEFLGASVYEVDEFQDALSRGLFDVLQFPLSIFDRRFIPLASEAAARGIRLVARSTMLQGLLTSRGLSLTRDDQPLESFLRNFREACRQISYQPQIAAVAWVLEKPFIDQVIIGFDSVSQLRDIAMHLTDVSWSATELAVLDQLEQPPRHLVDPRIWTWS